MKILYLIESEDPGGAENVMLSLVEYFKRKYSIYIGCFKKGWIYDELRAKKLNPKLIPTNKGPYDVKLLCQLVKLLKNEKVDLVHSHLFDTNFYSSVASWIARVPHISTEHGDIHHTSKKMGIKNSIKARAISLFSDKIVFVSQFTKDKFLKIAKVPEKKTAIIYNGIDLKEYEEPIDIQRKKAEIGIKEGEFIIGNVANLYPVKGQIFLLKAAQRVIKEIPNTKLLIIGRGALEDELKREARYLGIDSNIKFLGFREDVKELYKIMDIFVLSSLSEGLPLSLIEAMANKIPVVATNVGGVSEVIDDGLNGFLIPPADPNTLAIKIIRLLKDRPFANKLVIQSQKKINRQFNLHIMLNKYNEIYSCLT